MIYKIEGMLSSMLTIIFVLMVIMAVISLIIIILRIHKGGHETANELKKIIVMPFLLIALFFIANFTFYLSDEENNTSSNSASTDASSSASSITDTDDNSAVLDIIASDPEPDAETRNKVQTELWKYYAEKDKNEPKDTSEEGIEESQGIDVKSIVITIIAVLVAGPAIAVLGVKTVFYFKERKEIKQDLQANENQLVDLSFYIPLFKEQEIKEILNSIRDTINQVRQAIGYSDKTDLLNLPTNIRRMEQTYLPELQEQLKNCINLIRFGEDDFDRTEFITYLSDLSQAFSEIKSGIFDGDKMEMRAGMSAMIALLHSNGHLEPIKITDNENEEL